VEKNRLLMVAKHWPRLYFFKEWIKYIFRDTLSVPLYLYFKEGNKTALQRLQTRMKANLSLFIPAINAQFRGNRFTRDYIKKEFV
jgi:hypothetical protein